MKEHNTEFDKISNEVIGAAIEVHKALGSGLMESIYHNALKIELRKKGIKYESEITVKIWYSDEEVGSHRLDLVVNDEIIVELKTVPEISNVHRAQVMSYLKAAGLEIGLILNFSKPTLEVRRAYLKHPNSIPPEYELIIERSHKDLY